MKLGEIQAFAEGVLDFLAKLFGNPPAAATRPNGGLRQQLCACQQTHVNAANTLILLLCYSRGLVIGRTETHTWGVTNGE
jgi:hypothetical protein